MKPQMEALSGEREPPRLRLIPAEPSVEIVVAEYICSAGSWTSPDPIKFQGFRMSIAQQLAPHLPYLRR
jgi:hypothetical protein